MHLVPIAVATWGPLVFVNLDGKAPPLAEVLEDIPQRVAPFECETMRFVTSYSLNEAARGVPRILEYRVIPGDNGNGVRLIVNETLYTGPLSTAGFCAGFGADQRHPLRGDVHASERGASRGRFSNDVHRRWN